MKPATIILACLLCFSCATPSKLTKGQKIKEVCWQFLHVIDYKLTENAMSRTGEFKEANPLLGDHPSEGRLNTYAVIGSLSHFLTTRYLEEYREAWLNVTLGLKAVVVGNGFYVGAKVEF